MVSSEQSVAPVSSPSVLIQNGGKSETNSSSLDNSLRNSTVAHNTAFRTQTWTTKQKRFYHRLLSGMKRRTNGEKLRLLTLTTSSTASKYKLGQHWSALQMRIKRRYPTFNYIKIITNEGNGVIHCIYDGSYIPQKWLSNAWEDVHDSKIVDIRLLRSRTDHKRLSRYLVSHYLADHSYIRMSWSWDWVYRGFVSRWYLLKQHYKDSALKMWDAHLHGNEISNGVFTLYPDGSLASVEQLTLA